MRSQEDPYLFHSAPWFAYTVASCELFVPNCAFGLSSDRPSGAEGGLAESNPTAVNTLKGVSATPFTAPGLQSHLDLVSVLNAAIRYSRNSTVPSKCERLGFQPGTEFLEYRCNVDVLHVRPSSSPDPRDDIPPEHSCLPWRCSRTCQ